jgi:hypothetical protein
MDPFNQNDSTEQNDSTTFNGNNFDAGAEFDPWDSEAPVYRSLGFDTQQMNLDHNMDGSPDNMRSLSVAAGSASTMGMTSMYDDEAPVYRSLSVMPQLSVMQPSLGMGMPSMGMGKPSLGMGKPSLGGGSLGMPSLGNSKMGNSMFDGQDSLASSTSAFGGGAAPGVLEARVASLPLPCFYQLERTNHLANPGMADVDLARCISEALTDLGADYVLKAEKAKWKVRYS